jgi:hypothetical protein
MLWCRRVGRARDISSAIHLNYDVVGEFRTPAGAISKAEMENSPTLRHSKQVQNIKCPPKKIPTTVVARSKVLLADIDRSRSRTIVGGTIHCSLYDEAIRGGMSPMIQDNDR